MKSVELKAFISKIVKTADDMGAYQGQVAYNKRQMTWHRYDRSALKQKLSTLPTPVKAVLTAKLDDFYSTFAQFAKNPKTNAVLTKYAGMLWVVYGEDVAVDDEMWQKLESERPDLLPTARFQAENGLILPPNGTPKSVGSTYWLSDHGYAYQAVGGNEVQVLEGFKNRQLRPDPANRYKGDNPRGKVSIRPTKQGYGIFLDTQYGEVPVFTGQPPQTLRRFFGGLDYGASPVYVPPSGRDGYLNDEETEGFEPDEANENLLPSKGSPYVQNRLHDKFFRTFDIESDGTIVLVNRTGGPRAGGRTKRNVLGKKPMTPQQIRKLIPEDTMDTPWVVYPAQGEEPGPDMAVERNKIYKFSDKFRQALEDPEAAGRPELAAVGFNKLRELRDFIDTAKGGAGHTAYQGYKLFMVGPMFSSTELLDGGKTKTHWQMGSPKDVVAQNVGPEQVLVNRGVRWVVLSNEISMPRVAASGREGMAMWTRASGSGWTETEQGNASQAIAVLKSKIAAANGDVSIISDVARSVAAADQALRQAMAEDAGAPAQQPQTQPAQPQTSQLPGAQPQAPQTPQTAQQPYQWQEGQDPNQGGGIQTTADIKKWMRRKFG
jgi:hypothetical protein